MIETDLLQSLSHFSFSGFPAVRRQVRRPREQVIQKSAVPVIQMLRDLREKIFKIIIRFQSVGFRCFCNAIDDGAGLCPCDRIDHHPVFLTDAESPDRLLGGVIVIELLRHQGTLSGIFPGGWSIGSLPRSCSSAAL